MDAHSPSDIFLVGAFHFDRGGRGLSRRVDGGEHVAVHIGTRALDVLGVLVERRGELVAKDRIMAAVWPGTVVEENNLTVQVSTLRRVLDEAGCATSCIQTVPGRGYRFVGPVTRFVAPPGEPETLTIADAPSRIVAAPKRRFAAMAIGVVALAMLAAGIWLLHDRAAPRPAPYSPQDRRQSVIVLPFENSSGDPAQDDLAAGITRDLTDRIARGGAGPVVPAASAAAYRGKTKDLRTIGREQDVHFAVVGEARRQDGRLLVSATVYETAGSRPMWSEQLDRPDGPEALTAIEQIVYESAWQASVDVEATRALRDHPNELDERDLVLAALTTRLAAPTKANDQAKIALVERALVLDPDNLEGLERQVRWHVELLLLDYSSDPAADLVVAGKAADRLLAIAPNTVIALRAKATVLRAQGNWSEAEAVLRRVIGMQPTEANRRRELGQILMAEGRHREALESFQAAKRFAGGTDPIYSYDGDIAMAELALARPDEAIVAARLSISESPPETGRLGEVAWLALIAAESGSGQDEGARADLRTFLAAPRSWRSMADVGTWPAHAANPKLIEGLRRAGMPEH